MEMKVDTEMVSRKLTEYELKRLVNIKRNDELLASLKIKSTLTDLSASAKRHRAETKSYKVNPEKKAKLETPIIIRRSLRTQGHPPDSLGIEDLLNDSPKKPVRMPLKSQVRPNKSPRELGPISMRDANTCSESDESLVNKILSVCKDGDWSKKKSRVTASIDLDSMELLPENIAAVVPNRIFSLKFFPTENMTMVAVGDNFGNLGFWNVDSSQNESGDGVYVYHPHPGPVSSILIQPFSLNKIITSCYNGQIRSLDVEKETFELLCSGDHSFFSMSERPNDVNSLYIGEGYGGFRILDQRSPSSSFSWDFHDDRINTIDFNPENTNMMVTSSSDSTACIWDLRNLGKSKPKSLKRITRRKAIYSAYFSPSGTHLATTSRDNTIGVLGGANHDDEFMINLSGKRLTSFKGVWGWNDSYVFVGNLKRGVDVISTQERRLVTTLKSPLMIKLLIIPLR